MPADAAPEGGKGEGGRGGRRGTWTCNSFRQERATNLEPIPQTIGKRLAFSWLQLGDGEVRSRSRPPCARVTFLPAWCWKEEGAGPSGSPPSPPRTWCSAPVLKAKGTRTWPSRASRRRGLSREAAEPDPGARGCTAGAGAASAPAPRPRLRARRPPSPAAPPSPRAPPPSPARPPMATRGKLLTSSVHGPDPDGNFYLRIRHVGGARAARGGPSRAAPPPPPPRAPRARPPPLRRELREAAPRRAGHPGGARRGARPRPGAGRARAGRGARAGGEEAAPAQAPL